jgi:MFS family permease
MSVAPTAAPAPAKMSFAQQIASLPFNFWVANSMEMLERLAFFSLVAIRPMFAKAPESEHGLALDYAQIGLIFGVWAWLQCIIPMVSGGYTDRYGYRKSLIIAFVLNMCGYLLLARALPVVGWLAAHQVSNASFWVLMGAACLIGPGTAIFKPAVHGTLARVAVAETSSMIWGIFYWVVNLGGFFAPMLAATLRGHTGLSWDNVFYGCAIITALNFIPALFVYREPEHLIPDEGQKGPVGVFLSSLGTLLRDARFVLFLLIVSCFWFMFMQLWDLMPNFINEWVDTRSVGSVLKSMFGANFTWVLPSGQVKPEMIINIDSASIIALVLLISWMIRRMNKIAAMIVGMLIALIGFVGAGATSIGVICCVMIFVFAIGEMICSPTFSAYVGLIAPPARKALYMGYSNVPFAIGWGLGNFVSGQMYDRIGSKEELAREQLIQVYHLPAELAKDKKAFPGDQALPSLAYVTKTQDVTKVRDAISALVGQQKPEAEAIKQAYAPIRELVSSADLDDATRTLWTKYNPQRVWYYLGGFGLAGTVGMIIFYLLARAPSGEPDPATQSA